MTLASRFTPMSYHGMHEAYPELVEAVLMDGVDTVSPAGVLTRELLGVSFVLQDSMRFGVPVGTGRKVGRSMMTLDGAQNIAGVSYPNLAIKIAPTLGRFSDTRVNADGVEEVFFQGAYAPRFAEAMPLMERQLRDEAHTRRAIAVLFAESDRNPVWRDRPCTTHFQLYENAEGQLDVFVNMRANDVWTGVCYDIFQFAQVQVAMAHVLGMPVGQHYHYAATMHAYERDFEKLALVRPWRDDSTPYEPNPRESFGPEWWNLPAGTYRSWDEISADFRDMLDHADRGEDYTPRNIVTQWYWVSLSRALTS